MTETYVIMGVSGSGKSTVGQALAETLNCPFYDGDDYHPPENVAKMSSGIPLNDEDRVPWLAILHDLLLAHAQRGETAVLACSALKKKYRQQLREGNDAVVFIYLQGDFDLIWQRMQSRQHPYMRAEMLQSQFDTLEAPDDGEAIVVPITLPVEAVVKQIGAS
jgi:gluconokinase